MRASIVSYQLSSDINTALVLLLLCGCREFELRQLGLDGALDADPRWLAIAEKAVHLKRFRVAQIATDFFAQPAEAGGIPTGERIKKLFELAKRLNCNRVSIFGCHDDDRGDEPDDVEEEEPPIALPVEEALDALGAFVEAAASEKIEVVLRTHHETCAGTADEAVALIAEIDAKNFGLDWDPGESFAAGDGSGLDELETVLPVLKTVHLRDCVRRGMAAEWASLGKGVIPWEDLIEQLHEAGFRGPVICDPSVTPKLKESRHALTTLMRWIDAARVRKRPDREFPDDSDQ